MHLETLPKTLINTQLFLQACQKNSRLERPPVWLMRQAGRYMPEYQAIRSRVSFLELCKTPDLALEVTMQPLQAFGMDAAIMFSDILVPPEAMGMTLEFTENHGPQFLNPIRTAADVDALKVPDPVAETGFVMTLLQKLRQELAVSHPHVALLGFAGSPWTLATYMIEGGGSRNFTHLKTCLYNNPALLQRLLDKLTQTITLYLQAQVQAGAQAVQLFDTWAGILSAPLYRQFALPYQQRIIQALKATAPTVPVILYVNGSAHLLEAMVESGADVISVDHVTDLDEARRRLGPDVILQGNLDPNALFAEPEILQAMTQRMLDRMKTPEGFTGYVANLGHGILPKTPVQNVRLFVETVKAAAQKP